MSSNPPPAKKKKEPVAPASQDASIAGRQDDPTGIPKKKTEQEVNKVVASNGEINSVNVMPKSEEESQKGDGQKIPEPQRSSVCSNSEPPINPDKGSEKKCSVSEADINTSAKGLVLITGLPDGDWSENEVINLIQPFGNPTDIISALSLGKALVSVPDLKTAQEVVKAHISIPAKIKDCDLKIVDIKERVGIDTPVALYNLLMQSLDPLENSSPVSWNSLLVINNVPDTPTGAREVKQLVRRFGTVVKTLELKNLVICEMATSAMALTVYKRFQRFPCIIQNNPLFFSHKPDPKPSTPTQGLSSNLHSPEAIRAITEDGITNTADQDKKPLEENVSVDMEIGPDGLTGPQKLAAADESLEENGSLVTHEPRNVQSESALQPDTKTDKENVSSSNAVLKSHEKDESANETILLTTENVAELVKNKSNVGPCTSADVSSTEFSKDIPETQDEARTNQHPNKMAGSANEGLPETMGEKTHCQIKKTDQQKVIDGTKLTVKNHAEGGLKTKEGERIAKEAKQEKELKESERKIRRVQEKLQRPKRDRQQEDKTKRESRAMERKEELVQSSGRRSFCRFETCKSNSNVDQQKIRNKSDAEPPKMHEGEDFDSFPLSMGDFVTLDEVGDVTALDDFPHAAPEKTAEQEQSLTVVPLDTHEVAPLDEMKGAIAQSMKSDVPKTNCQLQLMTSEDPIVDVGHEPPTSACGTSDGVSSDVIVTPSAQTPQELCPVNQKVVANPQPEKNETETTASVSTECMVIVESLPTSISISTAVIDALTSDPHTIEEKMTSGKNTTGNATEEKQKATPPVDSPLNDRQTLTDRTQEMEKVQMKEDTWISRPSEEPATGNNSDIRAITDEKSKEKPQTETPMTTDTVHFDPSIPVGMEFLVPKTGFFCKVCNRFFSGSKDAQITHCKSLKHFENLQKYLETRKPKSELVLEAALE
ncbi:RNA-binding protein 20-like [Hippocampus zosterae]|uniref:RNA-binding protein 20-like n=1 Tax=Hippocampus zosterae TaxID=109293 RepID=UPI00223D2C2A|nr:RNA-binding protein 20-like [Hippocampus zosterae]